MGNCDKYCPEGTYSLIPRYSGTGGNFNVESSECPVCPPGKAAVKLYELEHFQTWPQFLRKNCKILNTTLTKEGACERTHGFYPSKSETLDSVKNLRFY
jgi:hypothetical protein